MKKGFTLIELLSVLGIMAILLLIAVPTYVTISQNMKERMYQAKVREILAKGESYAEETNNYAFLVNRLLEEGKISADDESGNIYDPRDKRKMNCDLIEISYQDNQIKSNLISQSECLSDEEINNRYGLLTLTLKGNVNETVKPGQWTNDSEVSVGYVINDKYKDIVGEITGLTWSGAEEKSCTLENIHECDTYKVSTTTSASLTVRLVANIKVKDTTVTNNYTTSVLMDVEAPLLKKDSIIVNNDVETNENKKVTFELTDNYGSGLETYALVTEKSCQNASYKDSKEVVEGTQTEYLDEKVYYICARDIVGNEKGYFEDGYQIDIKNIDKSQLKASLSITSKERRYRSKKVRLRISANKNASDLEMCVSQTGYLQDCSFESYRETKNIVLNGDYDGSNKTVYVTVKDKAGNLAHAEANYKLYKYCTRLGPNEFAYSNRNTCPKCGTAYYSATYIRYDKYIEDYECRRTNRTVRCNIPECDPVETMNPNDYESSKKVACNATYFQRLVNNSDRFKNALNYQNFRNALYDCSDTTASILRSSDSAYNILRNHSRTRVISGSGRGKTCICKYNQENKSAVRTCKQPACSGAYARYLSGNIYQGRVLVLSATTMNKVPNGGESDSACGDDNGFGDCDHAYKSTNKWGYRDIIVSDDSTKSYARSGWGRCTNERNGVINSNGGSSCTEKNNRIASFQDGVKVGLYSFQEWEYESESNNRWINNYQAGTVYVQIFAI